MDFFEIALGFILGCISSTIVTVVWYQIFVPKIKFADTICRYESMDKHEVYTYKIKFRNIGKRDIFEMYLYCTLFLPDLQMKDSTHTVDINLSYNFSPLFKRRGRKGKLNPDGLVRICLNDEKMRDEFVRPIYCEEINQKAENNLLTLEDLLEITPTSYIKFYIIAHDRFTGSKKVFESSNYTINNIKHGLYKYGDLYVVG